MDETPNLPPSPAEWKAVKAERDRYKAALEEIKAAYLADPNHCPAYKLGSLAEAALMMARSEIKRICNHKHCQSGATGCTGGSGSCFCKCDECTVIRNVYH